MAAMLGGVLKGWVGLWQEELSNTTNASALKGFVVPKLEVVIDEEKKVTHAELIEARADRERDHGP